MSEDKNKRIEALRSRVRSKLAASKKTSRDLPEINEEEEVIVKVEPQNYWKPISSLKMMIVSESVV